MIGRALDELGHAAPSTVASAAQEAMGGVTATGLVWTLSGGIAVLGAVFPPVGLILGGTMAVWNLMVDLDERATKKRHTEPSSIPHSRLTSTIAAWGGGRRHWRRRVGRAWLGRSHSGGKRRALLSS